MEDDQNITSVELKSTKTSKLQNFRACKIEIRNLTLSKISKISYCLSDSKKKLKKKNTKVKNSQKITLIY